MTQNHEPKVYAECTCGWEFERDLDAANLPEENNRKIADTVAGCHQFSHDFRRDGHEVTRRWVDE